MKLSSLTCIFFKSVFFSVLFLGAHSAMANADDAKERHILVVYFSQPEDVSLDGVDGISGASILLKNGEKTGSTQHVAKLIQEQTGGDIFRIEPEKPYPVEHQALLDYAEKEQKDSIRPEIRNEIDDFSRYDTVFIGYPIWWYKMPMIMYSFFEKYDFSDKKIIPFTTHGGSRFSDSLKEIKRLQPHTRLITKGLAISRNDVADENIPKQVSNWIATLTLTD